MSHTASRSRQITLKYTTHGSFRSLDRKSSRGCWERTNNNQIKNGLSKLEKALQFFSVALVHFSEQKWNCQNYLFNLHIILCTSWKQFLILLNKLWLLWYIHATDYVDLSAVSYIISCYCHVAQDALYSSLCPSKHLVISSSYKSLDAKRLI